VLSGLAGTAPSVRASKDRALACLDSLILLLCSAHARPSEAIIREFADADLAMVVARLDDMLPAMWQADYPGNTTPCYAMTR